MISPRSSNNGTREGVLVDISAEQNAAAAVLSGNSFPQSVRMGQGNMPAGAGISILDEPIENGAQSKCFPEK